jgi:aerobic carbon-monoxide dehydrogenase small subunit
MGETVTTTNVAITVNGGTIETAVEPNLPLASWLRDRLGLTGTHIGCETSQRGDHRLQCGFCTPGMVRSAIELAMLNPGASEAAVRAWLAGNFCRCTGYQNIVKSVLAGAAMMKQAG